MKEWVKYLIFLILSLLLSCLITGCIDEDSDFESRNIDHLIQDLGGSNDTRMYRAESQLREIGPPAVEPLILEFEDRNSSIRREAAHLLASIGDERATDPFIKAAIDVNESIEFRFLSIDCLSALVRIKGNQKAMDFLIQNLENENEELSYASVWALGNSRDKRAADPLVKILKNESKGDLRTSAAISLSLIGGNNSVEALITILNGNENQFLKAEAARSLGCIGDERAVYPLMHVANSDNECEYVREAAILALHDIENKD